MSKICISIETENRLIVAQGLREDEVENNC